MKNAKGLIILLVVFILITIYLGGFIIYDKFIEDGLKLQCINEDEIIEFTENDALKMAEAKYQVYLENLEKNIHMKTVMFGIEMNKVRNLYLDLDGYLYLEYSSDLNVDSNRITKIPSLTKDNNFVNGIKLNISNIVDIFFIEGMSQSAIETLYALDNQGNVYFIASSFDWDDSKIISPNFQPTKIEELKNIIRIDNYRYFDNISGSHQAEAVDIDGNKFDLLEYTNKYHIYDSAF